MDNMLLLEFPFNSFSFISSFLQLKEQKRHCNFAAGEIQLKICQKDINAFYLGMNIHGGNFWKEWETYSCNEPMNENSEEIWEAQKFLQSLIRKTNLGFLGICVSNLVNKVPYTTYVCFENSKTTSHPFSNNTKYWKRFLIYPTFATVPWITWALARAHFSNQQFKYIKMYQIYISNIYQIYKKYISNIYQIYI